MQAKRYLAEMIILLTLTGCGSIETKSENDVREATEQDNVTSVESITGEWERVDPAHIYILKSHYKGVVLDRYALIETEDDLTRSDISERFPDLTTDYPLAEYNYVCCLISDNDQDYSCDYVEYSEEEKRLRFHETVSQNEEAPALPSETAPKSRYTDWIYYAYTVAVIPKTFFAGKEIQNLHEPEELETTHGYVLVVE